MVRISASHRITVVLLLIVLCLAAPETGCAKKTSLPRVMDGDIIFQVSDSAQSKAIQLATQ